MKEYEGSLNHSKSSNMDPIARKAYNCYRNQKSRCYKKSDVNYKNYGARNIKVIYSVRIFIQWFIDNYDNSIPLKNVTVGRIDHNKDYDFDNIEIISRKENAKESFYRNINKVINAASDKKKKKVSLLSKKTNKIIAIFESYTEAAEILRLNKNTITKYINNKIKNPIYNLRRI